ncbi:MAG: avidin/streptavidin family protein [Bacteroidota bacterium]
MRRYSFYIVWIGCLISYLESSGQDLPEPSDLKGVWCSELESTLEVRSLDLETGEIRGSYSTPIGGRVRSFPLMGWVNTKSPEVGMDNVHVISFTVRWGELGSITSWAGTYQFNAKGEPILKTVWHLARPITHTSYEHIITQSSLFTFGACK